MGNLTISNIDDELTKRISNLADDERHALDRSVVDFVSERLGPSTRMQRRLAEARRISAMTPKGVVQTDSTLLIREDRDR